MSWGGGVFKISQHFKTLTKFDQIAEIMNKERGEFDALNLNWIREQALFNQNCLNLFWLLFNLMIKTLQINSLYQVKNTARFIIHCRY